VFLGRDWLRPQPAYSQGTGNRIDLQVRRIASEALDQAVALLKPRRALMDALVERLITEETIDGDSFRATVAGFELAEADVEAAQIGV
jgi:cell division protease FtsH